MTRRRCFSLVVLLLALLPARANAAEPYSIIAPIGEPPVEDGGGWVDVARCGGPVTVNGQKPALSPVIRSCTGSGTRTSILGHALSMTIGHGYTNGTIVARVRGLKFGGSFELRCTVITQNPLIPIGACARSGGSIGLEQVELTGSASGVGIWDVAYLQYVN